MRVCNGVARLQCKRRQSIDRSSAEGVLVGCGEGTPFHAGKGSGMGRLFIIFFVII